MVKKPFREGATLVHHYGCMCVCTCMHDHENKKKMQIKTQSKGYRFYRKKMRKNSETNQLRKREGEWD